MADIDELEAYADELQERGAQTVVVRWIDEKRPVAVDPDDPEAADAVPDDRPTEGRSSFTVKKVTEVTLKAGIDGEVEERTFEGLPYREVRATLAPYDFETIYRSNNFNR
jgi:hypothetical protein